MFAHINESELTKEKDLTGNFESSVYKGKRVAVERVSDEKLFTHESSILSRLSSSGAIPPVLGYSTQQHFFVMGYFVNTLEGYLESNPCIGWLTRYKIAFDTARRLDDLHSAGVIHQDFALQNLVLFKPYNIKVINFQGARIKESEEKFAADKQADIKKLGAIFRNLAPVLSAAENKYDIPPFCRKEFSDLIKECRTGEVSTRSIMQKLELFQANESLPNEDVAEYEPGSLLVEGSEGDVYKGIYNSQSVIIKIPATHRPAAQRVERNFAEVMKATCVQAPRTVRVLAYSYSPPYLITPLAEKGDLIDVLNKQPNLSFGIRVKIAMTFCEALNSIHEQGFIHQDIKLDNIVVGEDDCATLIDFSYLTYPGSKETKGSSRYYAPEIFTTGTSFATDVYSAGVTLSLLMLRNVDEKLFASEEYITFNLGLPSYVRIIRQRIHKELEEVRKSAALPAQIIDIIYACTQADPSKRPAIKDVLEVFEQAYATANFRNPRFQFAAKEQYKAALELARQHPLRKTI